MGKKNKQKEKVEGSESNPQPGSSRGQQQGTQQQQTQRSQQEPQKKSEQQTQQQQTQQAQQQRQNPQQQQKQQQQQSQQKGGQQQQARAQPQQEQQQARAQPPQQQQQAWGQPQQQQTQQPQQQSQQGGQQQRWASQKGGQQQSDQPQQQQGWDQQKRGQPQQMGQPQHGGQQQAWGGGQQKPGGQPGAQQQEGWSQQRGQHYQGGQQPHARPQQQGGSQQPHSGTQQGWAHKAGTGVGGRAAYQQKGGRDGGGSERSGLQQRTGGDGSRSSYQQRGGWGEDDRGGFQQRSDRGFQQRSSRDGDSGGRDFKPSQGREIEILRTTSPGCIPRGKNGQTGIVETNYLQLNLDKMPKTAYHYDVSIDPDRPKKLIRPAFELFNKENFPGICLAFDGHKSAYSVVKLPANKLNMDIEVKVEPGPREKMFKIVIKETVDMEIDLNSLKSYHKERIFDKPMRALQCLDVVLSNPCHSIGVRAGRSFYTKPDRLFDLEDGYELWFGLYQAAILGDQPFLNVDIAHKSFPRETHLTEYLMNNRVNLNSELQSRDKVLLTKFLQKLNIIYEAPKCFNATPKLYKVNGLVDNALELKFENQDKQRISVAEYFKNKGYKLQYPKLNCLHVGSSIKTVYLPLELCKVAPGQAVQGKDGPKQVQKMIRFSATSTDERKDKIMRLLDKFQHNRDATIEQFGLELGSSFIGVPTRTLMSPKIEYCKGEVIVPRNGAWRMNDATNFILTPKPATGSFSWCVIYSKQDRDVNIHNANQLGDLISKISKKLGMNLNTRFDTFDFVNIDQTLMGLKRDKYYLVFVILPFFGTSYAKVKQTAELKHGILTQCIKSSTVKNRGNFETVTNIMLKVNAKLNGANHRIAKTSEVQIQRSNIMFLGADVTHPSPDQKQIPSVVGVAASHDLLGTRYNMQYRLQEPAHEEIVDMESIFTQHMTVYKKNNQLFPDHIIYYRDGVSDGQFPIVKNIELKAIRSACAKLKCKPKLTCIIVVKRHHTRFFPQASRETGKFNNVVPGTVVDRIIVHPNEVQFFMVSHQSIQGTAKPTRYNVIEDDAKINIDDLQAMTYNLCHLFPRCNRVVSYPTPAYLAHLVAYRGRVYIEEQNIDVKDLKKEYSRRSVHPDVMNVTPMYFV